MKEPWGAYKKEAESLCLQPLSIGYFIKKLLFDFNCFHCLFYRSFSSFWYFDGLNAIFHFSGDFLFLYIAGQKNGLLELRVRKFTP